MSVNPIKNNIVNKSGNLIKVAEMNYTHSQQVQKIISKNKEKINSKELSFCHKLKQNNLYIFPN